MGTVGILGPFRIHVVSEGELAAIGARDDVDLDYAFFGRVTCDAPGEHDAARSLDLAIGADVIDGRALARHQKGKRAAEARISFQMHDLLVAQARTEHPLSD